MPVAASKTVWIRQIGRPNAPLVVFADSTDVGLPALERLHMLGVFVSGFRRFRQSIFRAAAHAHDTAVALSPIPQTGPSSSFIGSLCWGSLIT